MSQSASPAFDTNADQIQQLCDWIESNIDSTIGWEELKRQSGLSHKELINLFQIHKKSTPMLFIRQCRQQRQSSLGNTSPGLVPRQLMKPSNE